METEAEKTNLIGIINNPRKYVIAMEWLLKTAGHSKMLVFKIHFQKKEVQNLTFIESEREF